MQSSPPEMIRLLIGFQSTFNTTPSWAFHCSNKKNTIAHLCLLNSLLIVTTTVYFHLFPHRSILALTGTFPKNTSSYTVNKLKEINQRKRQSIWMKVVSLKFTLYDFRSMNGTQSFSWELWKSSDCLLKSLTHPGWLRIKISSLWLKKKMVGMVTDLLVIVMHGSLACLINVPVLA